MTFMIRLSFWKVELGPGYKYGFEINSLFLHAEKHCNNSSPDVPNLMSHLTSSPHIPSLQPGPSTAPDGISFPCLFFYSCLSHPLLRVALKLLLPPACSCSQIKCKARANHMGSISISHLDLSQAQTSPPSCKKH